jgi:hypothetical protein
MSEVFHPEHQEKLSHPEWHMPSRKGGFEDMSEVQKELESRTQVLGERELATEGRVVGFIYDPEEYDTHIEVYDGHVLQEVQLSLPDFLEADDDERSDHYRRVDEFRADIQRTCEEKLGLHKWWHNREGVENRIDPSYIEYEPTEQLIVGQEGRGVRFFNYGEPMSDARQEDCRKAVDVLAQFFGDHVYDVLQDVVIVPFKDGGKTGDGHVNGFTRGELEGVIFLNERLLPDDMQEPHYHLQDEEGVTQFVETLIHEFGHLLHGFGEEADEELLEFARNVGWDVDELLKHEPTWASGFGDLAPYAPLDDYIVTHEDGSKERVPLMDYYDKYDEDYDDEGKVVRPAKPFVRLGSPTQYGEESPGETFADTGAMLMLGDFVVRQYPETRDAWLSHAQKRAGGHALGEVPVNRAPIVVDHRTGQDILYPATAIPSRVLVRALSRRG